MPRRNGPRRRKRPAVRPAPDVNKPRRLPELGWSPTTRLDDLLAGRVELHRRDAAA